MHGEDQPALIDQDILWLKPFHSAIMTPHNTKPVGSEVLQQSESLY